MDSIGQNSVEIEKWLSLIRAEQVGPATFSKLLRHFSSIDRVLGASAAQLADVEGIGSKTAQQIARTRDEYDTKAELELAEKLGVWIIHLEDERYPAVLKAVYDPPPVLYIKGTLSRRDNLAIAIVGSRRCSFYGQEQASRFAHLLASAGFTIVSGMARGIDSAAHQGALATNGRTIAVQGSGLANPYPPENKKLFELICSSGACISELPLRYEPLAENFPPRNRIIAGLSLGVIVIEAALRSGALITARSALENSREVMAVPGKIDSPLSKGTHQLIKEGAKLVESVDDVREALGYIGQNLKEHVATSAQAADEKLSAPLFNVPEALLSENERMVINCLANEPKHIEEIIARTSLSAGNINASLVSLRLKGLVKQLPGSTFLRR
jgi:DNA processing protein